MFKEYFKITEEQIEAYSDRWSKWKRAYIWDSKPRVTQADIDDFYVNAPIEYMCDIENIAQINKADYLAGVGDVKRLKVLDFGAGTGVYGNELGLKGAEVHYFDLETPMSVLIKERITKGGYTGKFISDFESLDNDYDVIICIDVLEHVKKPLDLLKTLYGKLKGEGKIILETPLIEGLKTGGKPRFDILRSADREHLPESVKNWIRQKGDEWIGKNLIIGKYTFIKPLARVLLIYNYYEHTTGYYLERGLRRCCLVVTPRELPIIKPNGEGIKKVVKDLKIDLILQVDSGGWWQIPKNVGCATASWSVDTYRKTDLQKKYVKDYDFKFYAQRKYADDGYWLPLAADTDIYKRVNTDKKYHISFVGTVLVGADHEQRNELLQNLLRDFNLYVGKHSNEWANLKYNQGIFTFNYGIADDVNMRVFESMASGGCMLMNEVDGLTDLFEPYKHYLPYKDYKSLKCMVTEYMEKPEKIVDIIKNANEIIREKHTYYHRAKEILEVTKLLQK